QDGARAGVRLAELLPENAVIGPTLTHVGILRGTAASRKPRGVDGEPSPWMRPSTYAPAAARLSVRLEVVPQPEADLLFEAVERLDRVRLAVEVVKPEPHDLAGLIAPQPAGLRREVPAPIDLLPQVPVDGPERRSARAGRARP